MVVLEQSPGRCANSRDAGTSDASVKLVLRHCSCAFLSAKPLIESLACGYHSSVPQGCFPACFWTKRVSAPSTSSLPQDLGKKKQTRGGRNAQSVFLEARISVLSSFPCIRHNWRRRVSSAGQVDEKVGEMMVSDTASFVTLLKQVAPKVGDCSSGMQQQFHTPC